MFPVVAHMEHHGAFETHDRMEPIDRVCILLWTTYTAIELYSRTVHSTNWEMIRSRIV